MIELIVMVCALNGPCTTIHVQRQDDSDSLDGCHSLWVMARETAADELKVNEADLIIKELTCGRQPENGSSAKGG